MTLAQLNQVLGAGAKIVNDPALPRITRMILELNQLENKAAPPPPGQSAGIGLRHIEKPLAGYLYVRKNPWALWLGLGLVIGLPFALGYHFGGKRR